ncbi:hypothetical protein FOCG_07854 [Fusarium oxysporum f. sp. radicis-lycopersici 26381]|uniref:Uncharacterized protein n=1 Tax=Fusarium oxysporum Fo47 TaxID=660027 RepID=W9JMY6_FUSOX|nr:hypothetical protein FOZG_15146 [Fusarium oxysporum Fo47]EWZ85086.1 hypothetical protein FOWG_11595 [Fusarium oxysporum f. sp. lycopersici MN25]EXL52037.1 hypothetical protein FOCG_07854 [Fusarium oxysporum f. sp. radicis-lycopersici 26381]
MDSYDDFQSTPTGKVSKAKKGKPVHVCSECQKVYTRAEHLRYNFSTYISDKESMLNRQQAASVFAPRAPVRMPKAESLDSSVGALSLKQKSPGGNESEPVQASVSGDDNKPVCLSLEKATTSLQTVESKEYTEG